MQTRLWFRVHSFSGVITGFMLFVICWSGTFAVLSHEMDWLVTPEARVERGTDRVSWDVLREAARTALPEGEVTFLRAPLYSRSAVQAMVDSPRQSSMWVYIDPYTGNVQGTRSYFNIQRFFRSFHYALFLPEAGVYIVSAFAITMLTSLVAALVFYKRWWQRFFRFPRGRGRAFWSELHKAVGLWSIWFVLVIGLTGGWYLYEEAQHDLFDGPLNYVGNAPIGVVSVPAPDTAPTLPMLPLDEVIAKAERAWPEFEITTVASGWYSGGEDAVYLQGHTGGLALVRGRANQMHLDPRTAEILWQNSSGDLPLYWVWSNMADPLHFGNFAGLTGKIVWFVFGLLLCGLILTGTWLHAHRLAREAGGAARHRWPGTGAAIVVTLLILAASVPYGFHEAREFYGPTVDGAKQLPTLAPGVRAVIIGWVAVTLAIIAGWVVLLWRPQMVLERTGKHSPNSRRSQRAQPSEGSAAE